MRGGNSHEVVEDAWKTAIKRPIGTGTACTIRCQLSFHKATSPAFQSMGRDDRPMCCGMRCFRTAPGAPEAKNDWSFSTRVQGFQMVQRLAPRAIRRAE